MKFEKTNKEVLQIADDVLIFDIETNSLDTKTAKMVWFGAFSFKYNKYFFYTYHEREEIQKLIKDHRVVVGFNSKFFDLPIMENNGLNVDYKIQIDLLRVLFTHENRKSIREGIIKVDGKILKDILSNHKLKTIAQALKLSVQKGDINYNIFKQDEWNSIQIQEILKYLYYDVKITKELFEYMYKEFLPMKQFMSPLDQQRYNWYRTSMGSYTYKVICYHAGIEEEYDEHTGRKKYEGGFVSAPAGDLFRGNIYCLDFSSAYPHSFLHGNLYSHSCSCCTEEEKWSGNELFPIEGKYCKKSPGKVEKVIKKFYLQRLEYKKNKDPREFAVKIILNTMYGISGSSVFKNLHSLTTASDCTLMARQMVKLAREIFKERGYELIYTDTDSVYLCDPYNDKTRLLAIKDIIINKIKENIPFPQETFGMGIDEEIKAIWFFRDERNDLKKKNYMYITKDNRIKVKGLAIIKSACSRLTKKVMAHIKSGIIQFTDIKFDRSYIEIIVKKFIDEDLKN